MAAFLTLLALAAPRPAGARPRLIPLSPYTSFDTPKAGSIGAPVFSPDGQWLAFLHAFDPTGRNPRAVGQLFVCRVDNSEIRQLSPGDTLLDPRAPAWSPDAQRLYFTATNGPQARRELYRVDRDGANLTRLTFQTGTTGFDPIARGIPAQGGVYFCTRADLGHEGLTLRVKVRSLYFLSDAGVLQRLSDPAAATWDAAELLGAAVDGSRVLYAPEDRQLARARPLRPYRLNRGSTTGTPLTPAEGSQSLEAAVTPSGQWLYLSSNADYNGQNSGLRAQIFRINTQTAAVSQLTTVPFGSARRPTADSAATRVAFDSDASLLPGENSGTSRVYLAADGLGRGLKRVSVGREANLTWDAQRVAFVSEADSLGLNRDLSTEIFSQRTDGAERRQHSRFVRGVSQQPALSTDGAWVVFTSTADLDGGNADGSREVYRVRADGTDLKRLTDGPRGTSSDQPSISADGRAVAFISTANLATGQNSDGNAEVFRITTGGDSLEQVTKTTSGSSGAPRISAGGDTIAFVTTAPVLLGTSYGSGRVAVWSRRTRVFRLATPGADRPIESFFMSDDGMRLALLTQANLFSLNVNNNRTIYTVGPSGAGFRRVALAVGPRTGGLGLSANGRWLAVSDVNNVVSLRDYAGTDSAFVFAAAGVPPVYPTPDSAGARVLFATAAPGGGFEAGDYILASRFGGAPTALIGTTQVRPPEPPALSGDGQRMVFTLSSVDSLNPDGSVEVMASGSTITPVRTLEFRAEWQAEGGLRLTWWITADDRPAAFRVERATAAGSRYETRANLTATAGDAYAWLDPDPPPGAPWYRIAVLERDGSLRRFGPWPAPARPEPGALRVTVWPNPSAGVTRLRLSVREAGPARLRVFDVRGRLVRRLFDGPLPAGDTQVEWDGRDEAGDSSAAGLYYVRVDRPTLRQARVTPLVRLR